MREDRPTHRPIDPTRTNSKTHPDPTKLLHVLATPTILVPFALFEAHYMLNNGFLRRGQLLDNAATMITADMPVRIVHGRCDFVVSE